MAVGTLMTIGHSTLSIESFLRALTENGCELLVDIRRHPGSRRYPHFGQERLFDSLEARGIRALWREGLGGRRKPEPDSANSGLRNPSFRGYADYMQGVPFAEELQWLLTQISMTSVAVMCAEAVPWRCHRYLLSDAVLARGPEVQHILVAPDGASTRRPHVFPAYARVQAGRISYPADVEAPAPRSSVAAH